MQSSIFRKPGDDSSSDSSGDDSDEDGSKQSVSKVERDVQIEKAATSQKNTRRKDPLRPGPSTEDSDKESSTGSSEEASKSTKNNGGAAHDRQKSITLHGDASADSDQETSEDADFESDEESGNQGEVEFEEENTTDSLSNNLQGAIGPLARLAPRDTSQHSTLLLISLIEARSKTQAALSINTGRAVPLPESHPKVCELAQSIFHELSRQLSTAGILPRDFPGAKSDRLRSQVLNTFDAASATIASRLAADHVFGSVDDSVSWTSDIFDRSNALPQPPLKQTSSALALKSYTMATELTGAQNYLRNTNGLAKIILGITKVKKFTSIYEENYQQICRLGKGGYGSVYLALHYLDKQKWAVKKIVISPGSIGRICRMNPYDQTAAIEALLKEAHALARLNHPNIVQYRDVWFEVAPVKPRDDKDGESDSDDDPSIVKSDAGLKEKVTSDKAVSKRAGETTATAQDMDSAEPEVQEEYSSIADGFAPGEELSGFVVDSFRGLHIDNEKQLQRLQTLPSQGESASAFENDGNIPGVPIVTDAPAIHKVQFKAIIHIKMTAHEMSLKSFLNPGSDLGAPRHCYHTASAVRLLLAILDGVEYIHSEQIIHRDLKPANIFLSFKKRVPPHNGYFDMTSCTECGSMADKHDALNFVIPHIGDFGIVADVSETSPAEESDSGMYDTEDSFPVAPTANNLSLPVEDDMKGSSAVSVLSQALSPPSLPKAAGTTLYIPPTINTPCPKLDVYSMGIMAFELICKFTLKSERIIILQKLREGILPEEYRTHPMADGILHMTDDNRRRRWNCTQVRAWLNRLKEAYN